MGYRRRRRITPEEATIIARAERRRQRAKRAPDVLRLMVARARELQDQVERSTRWQSEADAIASVEARAFRRLLRRIWAYRAPFTPDVGVALDNRCRPSPTGPVVHRAGVDRLAPCHVCHEPAGYHGHQLIVPRVARLVACGRHGTEIRQLAIDALRAKYPQTTWTLRQEQNR